MANLVITIGRESGSGGRQLGSELAEALGNEISAVILQACSADCWARASRQAP